jgi:phosphoribosylpyrophosphate synthetase
VHGSGRSDTAATGDVLSTPSIDSVIVTDTVAPGRIGVGPLHSKLTVVSIAPLLARAISALHHEVR